MAKRPPLPGLSFKDTHSVAPDSDGSRAAGSTGELSVFAENDVELNGVSYRNKEWAGACFDPSGEWLFVNIWSPGITFAITGPWRRGPL